MKILITGGTGFVGKKLSEILLSKGYEVIVTGTRPEHKVIHQTGFHYISADTSLPGEWQKALQNVNAVINLAGRNIFHRWTAQYKKQIYDSRILTTRNIVDALPDHSDCVLFSTSAVGYYGNRGDAILTEGESHGKDFLATVCKDWEYEAFKAEKKGIHVVIGRFGVVLGEKGGALETMMTTFRYGFGGPIGDGMHWFPWIHMDDLIRAILFVIENRQITGALNFCSPNPVRNKDFAHALGHAMNRPSFFPTPGFMLRLIMGELGEALLSSQRAIPAKLTDSGFQYHYPDIEASLQHVIK